MIPNYYQNTLKNFSSDYFCLIPSKYVTLGIPALNKTVSQISENSSNKDNNSVFRPFPSLQADKFKFGFNNSSSKDKFMNNYTKNNTTESNLENNVPKNSQNFLKVFKYSSKTVLNIVNSCLLDLFLNDKDNNSEDNNTTNINISGSTKNKYILKSLNEDCIIIKKENRNENINNKSVSFSQKINFSPIKNIPKSENINKIKINEKKYQEDFIATNQKSISNVNNNLKFQDKSYIHNVFNIINNNYENPAKILPQFNQAPEILNAQNILDNNIKNITNITNVTNNYFFQYNNGSNYYINQNDQIKDDKILNNIIINKKNSNSNSLYGLYQLNQISVNGVSISKFPVVSMNEDDLEVQLLSKMLNETDYFTIVDKYYINIPVLDEEKYNKPLYDKIFKKEKEKISDLYLIGKNLNENNPVNLIRNYYSQIKNKILQIQNNYLSNNKQLISLNKELCKELEKLIISCNAITNTVTDYKKSGLKRKVFQEIINEDKEKNENFMKIININKDNSYKINDDNFADKTLLNKKRNPKKKHFKTYLCEFCNKAYSNGQGLGGHMSRIHPNQSYKYKDKIRIRREREEKRENLLNIKRDLFKKYGYDYDELSKEKNKSLIQKFLSVHTEEYKNIRKINHKNDKNNENTININEDNEGFMNKDTNYLITPIHPNFLKISSGGLGLLNNFRKNFSKEKTCYKTDIKNSENKFNDKKEEIGFETKIKINFSEN